jgi:UDP-glucose 4-epimerase
MKLSVLLGSDRFDVVLVTASARVVCSHESRAEMRVLITGGAGFIGSHLVEYLQADDEITVLDDLRTGTPANLSHLNCRFLQGSVLDPEILEVACREVDQVYHLAALVSVPESMAAPELCVDINVTGTLRVLAAAKKAGAAKVVIASSAAVYGDNPQVPKYETMLPEPRSPYAMTKLDGEFYCDLFDREHGLPTASLRFFNVFGPRQNPKSAYAAAVPIFIEKALRGEPLTIFGTGHQTRDFIYVKDIVSALAYAGRSQCVRGVFNVGYGSSTSVLELARQVLTCVESRSRIEYRPPRIGDVMHSVASSAKLMEAGWRPQYSVPEGLSQTVASFRAAHGAG